MGASSYESLSKSTASSAINVTITLHTLKMFGTLSFSSFYLLLGLFVFVGSATILQCVWSPDNAKSDFNKLPRIMYLYDAQACGYELKKAKSVQNLQFSNNTFGLPLLPIKWKKAIKTVSTRLSAKTRKYIELSLIIHGIWMVLAIGVRIFTRQSTDIKVITFALSVFFYACICVIIFDLSMAIVYIAHIKQSLTKGMILRYSGWSVKLKLKHNDVFAGWLPIVASVCWMKGIVILAVNIYCCRVIKFTRKKITRREVKKKIVREENMPIPEPDPLIPVDNKVLVYRNGEKKPYVKNDFPPFF